MAYQIIWSLMVAVAIGCTLYRRRAAFYFLCLFAIFPASAVLVIGQSGNAIGISPYYAYAVFIFFLVLMRLNRALDTIVNRQWIHLTIFSFITVVGAFILPILFEGLGVYSPRLGIDDQVNVQTPLVQSFSQIGQAAYLVLNFSVVVYIYMNVGEFLNVLRNIFYVALIIALWQLIAKVSAFYFPSDYIANNPAYGYLSTQLFYGIPRINGSFLEASTASAYFSSMLALFIGLYFQTHRGVVNIILALFATLITTSSTGVIVIILLTLSFCVNLFITVVKQRAMGLNTLLPILVMVGLFLFLINISNILHVLTFGKIGSLSYVNRNASNEYAVGLIYKTFGVGVGLGSNRPSSFATYILSNLGLFPAFLLASSVVTNAMITKNKIILWPFLTYLVAKVIAIPDLNDVWFWIYFALILAGHRDPPVHATGSESLPSTAGVHHQV
ncbi:hypothetical protein HNQ07_001229 [Deinococcus metalli]|uniref:Uncharacterized protein n=1 Tax=Deinococcus metalli TaxID=1141878 RepID=A0A7W8NR49_9DEIO|nr:hypothetical protein [Deinococcus metalli]MBB5375772.1 hypothetical protein [Deinococcus metalli]